MRRTLFTNYLIPCRLSTDPEMCDLGWLWLAWMFIIHNSIGCGQCLRPKMLSDIFSLSFTLLLPNWLLISIRIYSGIARFPCDSMAFLFILQQFSISTYHLCVSAWLHHSACLSFFPSFSKLANGMCLKYKGGLTDNSLLSQPTLHPSATDNGHVRWRCQQPHQ